MTQVDKDIEEYEMLAQQEQLNLAVAIKNQLQYFIDIKIGHQDKVCSSNTVLCDRPGFTFCMLSDIAGSSIW